MIERIANLCRKHKCVIMYAIFGVLTTVINLLVYRLCFLMVGNITGTIIAWIAAVVFAFITNKLWVFDSKCFDSSTLIPEVLSFFGARIATGFLDVEIMYVAVNVMSRSPVLWKLISNVIVIVMNYVLSKIVVFRKRTE